MPSFPSLKRIATALVGSVLLHYPFWFFTFDAANLQKLKPWSNNFQTMCISDCPIYANLSLNDPTDGYRRIFFPLFPKLIGLFNQAVPSLTPVASTIAVSNFFALIASILLLFLGDKLWASSTDTRFGFKTESWILLLAVSIFPHHHFWMQGYTEPLFVSLFVGLLLAVSSSQWALAGVFAGLTAVTRPQGIWVMAIVFAFFGFLWLKKRIRTSQLIVSSTLAAIPLLCFMYWHWQNFDNPLAFLSAQSNGYGRGFDLLRGAWEHRPRWDVAVAYLYASLWAGVTLIKRRGDIWKILALTSIAFADLPLYMGGFYSYVRFMSVNIGMFVFFTEFSKRRIALGVLLAIWAVTRLGGQVYHAAFGLWTG